jgi:hypothetical protein
VAALAALSAAADIERLARQRQTLQGSKQHDHKTKLDRKHEVLTAILLESMSADAQTKISSTSGDAAHFSCCCACPALPMPAQH